MPAELGIAIDKAAEPIAEPKIPEELLKPAPINEGVMIPLPPSSNPNDWEPVSSNKDNSKPIPVMEVPEEDRTNPYPDRSYNWVNDHYDSSVNYDKMYGALV